MAVPSTPAIIAALLSTLLISLAPNLILLLFPNYASTSATGGRQSWVLSIGQALAAGGLLGDVFLHTLPHSMAGGESGGHGHGHGDDDVGITVLIGFGTFLIFDVLVRALGGDQHHHHHGHCHDHGAENREHGDETTAVSGRSNSGGGNSGEGTGVMTSNPAKERKPNRIFNSTILLNLTADSLHNFTDGLAIGASFAAASTAASHHSGGDGGNGTVLSLLYSRGGLASLSVLFHEIPHELGDFAVLVGNGLSKRQAIMAQFSTALAAFAGTILGLAASTFDEKLGHEVLLPFTAGGFVYLAAVVILPELLEERKVGGWVRTAQIVAFGVGVAFMQAVAVLEDMHHDHHGHGGHWHGHGHGHDHGGHGHEDMHEAGRHNHDNEL